MTRHGDNKQKQSMTCKSNESNNKKEWKEECLKIPKRK